VCRMWFWQRKSHPKKYQFLGKLFLLFLSFHCIVMFGLFFVYSHDTVKVSTINLRKTLIDSEARIVYLPLQKRIKRQPNKKIACFSKKTSLKKVPAKKKPQPAPKKKKKTSLQSVQLKKQQKKKIVPPVKKIKQTKKIEQKTIPKQKPKPKSPVKPKEKSKTKEPVKPKQLQTKKEQKVESKSVSKKQEPQKRAQKEESIVKPDPVQIEEPIQEELEENVIYLGREDMQAYKLALQIQQELERHWSPPPGLPKDLTCTVALKINLSGKVEAEVTRSSGVLLYDIPARSAALSAQLPKLLWGKELTVVF